MDAKIQKWGNKLVLRIPKAFAEKLDLTPNADVRLSLEGDRLIVKPIRRLELSNLLAGVTPENLHAETDWGAPNGNEM